ncbi:POU domain, class 6, transcription factor 2 [Homalodisca vitripennis]|nr:POU domain, class 6, transcription factor 2 [Homalodisca vitripennis]
MELKSRLPPVQYARKLIQLAQKLITTMTFPGPLSMAGMVSSPPQPPQLLAAPQPAAMPQFILASGQLVQGIQGAQLLIPTSQGEHLQEHYNSALMHNADSKCDNFLKKHIFTTISNT